MKCFHFTNGERRSEEGEDDVVSSVRARVSWARSLSIASSTTSSSTTEVRRSEFAGDSEFSGESAGFFSLLAQNRRVCNDLKAFTFAELKSATRGFSRGLLIGEGGFGCVYKGVVDNVRAFDCDDFEFDDSVNCKIDVAVKQLNRYGSQGHKEWINEVNWLGVIKHPNLVKLVGYCAEDDERGMQRLLVYELMKNKSLEDHLLGRVPSPLPWMTRLKIAQDAARGLAYLHEEMDFQLIFRDFKTSNVLLDEDFNAKLSDFGLARLGPAEGYSHISTAVVGTVGYAAPEYVLTGKLTIKSDVWSFGVVLYELITGRRAVEKNLPRGEQKLLEWVRPFISDSKKFHLIVDSRLDGQYCKKSAQRLASLANKCLAKQPKSRPKMSEVVEVLGSIMDEASSEEETESKPVEVAEDESEEQDGDTEPTKPGKNYLRKVREIKEKVNLKNKSIGKLDWKNWTPGLVKTL
ncbi:probable serine/threonine-protein kinase PBL19 [Chenopodium quinoa]|uniref:probable serine/threonine-protein kinase PBL19 n=1 Tax=Chenopodium quinoa TaxID=63459 RepID=UPI000B7730D5|nr:probable serine/threonine-protein kinase PBL19 [Chenopodium quinoa]